MLIQLLGEFGGYGPFEIIHLIWLYQDSSPAREREKASQRHNKTKAQVLMGAKLTDCRTKACPCSLG